MGAVSRCTPTVRGNWCSQIRSLSEADPDRISSSPSLPSGRLLFKNLIFSAYSGVLRLKIPRFLASFVLFEVCGNESNSCVAQVNDSAFDVPQNLELFKYQPGFVSSHIRIQQHAGQLMAHLEQPRQRQQTKHPRRRRGA